MNPVKLDRIGAILRLGTVILKGSGVGCDRSQPTPRVAINTPQNRNKKQPFRFQPLLSFYFGPEMIGLVFPGESCANLAFRLAVDAR